MDRKIELNTHEIESVRKLVREKRFSLGFSEEPPIANDIFTLLDKLNIILLEYPIESSKEKPSFSALLLYSEEGGESLVFIGLNTADYLDKQIFAIAHELYHYFTKSASQTNQNRNEIIEAKANWFAAEFLFPESVLRNQIVEEFTSHSLANIKIEILLRFIARLHCTWWLPYRSLVKRLWEIDAITKSQFQDLYSVNERDLESTYGKIGLSTKYETFLSLNTITKRIGSSPKAIETILRNFEDGLIEESSFITILGLFNKSPSDYGYEISVSKDDIDEMNDSR